MKGNAGNGERDQSQTRGAVQRVCATAARRQSAVRTLLRAAAT